MEVQFQVLKIDTGRTVWVATQHDSLSPFKFVGDGVGQLNTILIILIFNFHYPGRFQDGLSGKV